MDGILHFQGDALQALLRMIRAYDEKDYIFSLRLVDDDGLKVSVNHHTWTAPMGPNGPEA